MLDYSADNYLTINYHCCWNQTGTIIVTPTIGQSVELQCAKGIVQIIRLYRRIYIIYAYVDLCTYIRIII